MSYAKDFLRTISDGDSDLREHFLSGNAARSVKANAEFYAHAYGEGFIVHLAGMLSNLGIFDRNSAVKSFRHMHDAQEFARDLVDSGWPRKSVKITRVKI